MRLLGKRTAFGCLASLFLVSCDQTVTNLPTDGIAHSSAYELGFQVSTEIANRDYPLPSDQRWLAKAKKADAREGFKQIAEEIGDFVAIDTIICNDIMPLEKEGYPVRVRCWTNVQNECKYSKIVVVVASENGRWDDPNWGILGFGMQRSLVEHSKC